MSAFLLKHKGNEYTNYKHMRVRTSAEALAWTWEVTLVGHEFGRKGIPFQEEDEVEVWITGQHVISGRIDSVAPSYSERTDYTVSMKGRSMTGNLIDCSAIYKTGKWRDTSPVQMAKDVAEPFGIEVSSQEPDALKPMKKWAIEDEELAGDFIIRLGRQLGLYPVHDGHARLAYARGASLPGAGSVVQGKNTKAGTFAGDWTVRYSEYIVKNQVVGNAAVSGESVANRVFKLQDPDVRTYRPLVLVADGSGRQDELERRAHWERSTRASRSLRAEYTIPGLLHHETAQLWRAHTLVDVQDPVLGINGQMLILSCEYSGSPDALETHIVVAPKESLDVMRTPKPRRRGSRQMGDYLTSSAADEEAQDQWREDNAATPGRPAGTILPI